MYKKTWLILLCGLITACGASVASPAATLPPLSPDDVTWVPLPTIQPRPAFIEEISPPESSTIPLPYFRHNSDSEESRSVGYISLATGLTSGFESNICARIDLGEVVQPGDDMSWSLAEERLQLSVIGEGFVSHDADGLSGGLEVGHVQKNATWENYTIYCWQVPLEAGSHTLNLQFRQTSGSILEYTWQFALSDE